MPVLETVQSKVRCAEVLNTHLFDFEKASMAPGWLKEMRGTHVPETEEYCPDTVHSCSVMHDPVILVEVGVHMAL